MKVASEWVEGPGKLWELTCTYESDHTPEQLISIVGQVQIDALIQGVRDAANMAQQFHDEDMGSPDPTRRIFHGICKELGVDTSEGV